MSERPNLHKHHSSSSAALTSRSPAQRGGAKARVPPRAPPYARNVNKTLTSRTVLPRNKSKTVLRKNQSETALYRRNRSTNELALRRTGGAAPPPPDDDEAREKDDEDDEDDENGGEGREDEQDVDGDSSGEEDDEGEGGGDGVSDQRTDNNDPSLGTDSTQSAPSSKSSSTPPQSHKQPERRREIHFATNEIPAARRGPGKTTEEPGKAVSEPPSIIKEPVKASSPSTTSSTSSKKPTSITTAPSAMNLQASLNRDRALTMQPMWDYPPSVWRDSRMREVTPHLRNPNDEYSAKYHNRIDRIIDRKLESLRPVADPTMRSLDRIDADPVAAEIAAYKSSIVPKPQKTGLGAFLGRFSGAKKKVEPEYDWTEWNMRVDAAKKDMAKLKELNPALAKQMMEIVKEASDDTEAEWNPAYVKKGKAQTSGF